MGILQQLRRLAGTDAVGQALRLAKAGRVPEALAAVAGDDVVALGRSLLDAGHAAEARVVAEHARRSAPDDVAARALVAEAAAELGELETALVEQRAVVAARPGDLVEALFLARLLRTHEAFDEISVVLQPYAPRHDPDVDELLGEALFATERAAASIPHLRAAVEYLHRRLKHASEWSKERAARASALESMLGDAIAEIEGAEEVVWETARRGELVAGSGVNHMLLAKKLMLTSDAAPLAPTLESTGAWAERAKALRRAKSRAPEVLLLEGVVALRDGDLGTARARFEAYGELRPDSFAGPLGYGATLVLEEHASHAAVRKLPDFRALAGLEAVVPDWPALTPLEQRVVAASIHPLRGALPTLQEGGVQIRILALDARATNLPEFAELVGERHDDHRSYHAIEGLAGDRLAIAKIEELLRVDAGGWTFAHEFAHLVHPCLPEHAYDEVERLYARAVEVVWASGAYQLRDPHEFLAVSYTAYLQRLYRMPDAPPLDDAGIAAASDALFERLGRG